MQNPRLKIKITVIISVVLGPVVRKPINLIQD